MDRCVRVSHEKKRLVPFGLRKLKRKPPSFYRMTLMISLLVLCHLCFVKTSVQADTSVGGVISTDTTWTLSESPYVVSASIIVKGTDGADGITTLTIEPGVEVRFNRYQKLEIGAGAGDPGALIAQGTAEEPIVFTSSEAEPAPGDWYGLRFLNTANDDTCLLKNCVIDYGGYGNQGSVYCYDARPTLVYCKIRQSSHAGLYISGDGCNDAQINCNNFQNNAYGVYAVSNALPIVHNNNFIGNTTYGVYNGGTGTLNAENNWWGDAQGPGFSGDAVYGNVDVDPWLTEENDCSGGEVPNNPPYVPGSPIPEDNAVHVSVQTPVTFFWSGGDPDFEDMVTYDLFLGDAEDNLSSEAADLAAATYDKSGLAGGKTYFWQVIAKDAEGLTTPGPIWHFTTEGDPPDLIVSSVTPDPAGGLSTGQAITFTATIENVGTGPLVDAIETELTIDGISQGSEPIGGILYAGSSVEVVFTWTYNGGDPSLELTADSGSVVS